MATDTIPTAPTISVKIDGAEDNQVTLQGALKEVNLADKTCRVYTSDIEFVTCHFDDELEPDVIYALGTDVEVSGSVVDLKSNGSGFRVAELELKRIGSPDSAGPPKIMDGPAMIEAMRESGVLGMWADREDLQTTSDVINYTRRLRGRPPLSDDEARLYDTLYEGESEVAQDSSRDIAAKS